MTPLITKEPIIVWSSNSLSGVVLSSANPPVIGDVELLNKSIVAIGLGSAGEMEAVGGMLAVWAINCRC